MALLASCWLLLESFIIPEGFLKWFYLSFYIHPLLLVCCQIFLWLKVLKKWLLLLFLPLTTAFRLGLFVFKMVVVSLFSFTTLTRDEVFYDALGTHIQNISWEVVVSCGGRWDSPCNETDACRAGPNPDHCYESTEEIDVGGSWLNEYLYSDRYHCSASDYDAHVSEILVLPDQDNSTMFHFSSMDPSVVDFESSFSVEFDENSTSQVLEDMLIISQEDSLSPISNCDSDDSLMLLDRESCASNSPLKQNTTSSEEDVDSFHQKYTSRMRFYNVLYNERLHGMNAILNDQSTSPGFFNCAEPATDTPMQLMWWSRVARKRILRSLECDLETIYVAQSCLFWEALYHQHVKVEALTISENAVFDHIVSVKFQELEILLVRFVEDQKCECQGSSSNTLNRLSFQGLLQVPDATGFMIGEEENKSRRGEGIRATQVLEAIDSCIQAFWLYLKTDNKKLSTWKHESIWRAYPPVEDPQDLELLYNVTKTLHKKGIMLKDVQGKSKCWLRRKVKGVQTEEEKRSVVFAMIDMKLVRRLLEMSLVSRSHLRWCQEKLNNLDFKQGKVLMRGAISHLFPSS